MTEITDEVRLSLTEAGIGKKFHDKTLADDQVYGDGMRAFLKTNGDAIRRDGKSVWFHGIGLTDTIKLFCRGLHIHGVGCKIVPLVHMRRIINNAEFRETVTDIDVLVILAGQDARVCNPLHPNVMADVEELIRDRFERERATFIHFAIDPTVNPVELDNCYWSAEFMEMVLEGWEELRPNAIKALGKIK